MGTQRPPKSLLNHPPSHTHTQLHRKRHSGRYQVPMGNQHTTLHTMNDTLPLPLHLFLHQSLFEAQHVEDWLHPSLVVVSLWILVVGALEKASSPGSGTPSGSSWLNRELDQSTIQDGAMIQGRSRWEDFVLARIQGGNHGGRWCLALFDLWRWVLFFLLAVILRTSEPLLYRRYYKLPIAVSLLLSPLIADFLFSFCLHTSHTEYTRDHGWYFIYIHTNQMLYIFWVSLSTRIHSRMLLQNQTLLQLHYHFHQVQNPHQLNKNPS